jgi:hypothetical protein
MVQGELDALTMRSPLVIDNERSVKTRRRDCVLELSFHFNDTGARNVV